MRANYTTPKKPAVKAAPAKASRRSRAVPASGPAVKFAPHVEFRPTIIPVGDGRFEVLAGKPIVTNGDTEIGTAEFAAKAGLSADHVAQLCEQGVILHRRKSPAPKSPILITGAELARFLERTKEER